MGVSEEIGSVVIYFEGRATHLMTGWTWRIKVAESTSAMSTTELLLTEIEKVVRRDGF